MREALFILLAPVPFSVRGLFMEDKQGILDTCSITYITLSLSHSLHEFAKDQTQPSGQVRASAN